MEIGENFKAQLKRESGDGNHRFFLSLHLEGNFIQFIDHSIVNHCSCPAAF